MYRSIFKNAFHVFTGNAFISILSLCFMAILTRFVGIEDYGIYIVFQSSIVFYSLVTRLNTFEPTIKKLSDLNESNCAEFLSFSFSIDFYGAFVSSFLSIIFFVVFFGFLFEFDVPFYIYILIFISIFINIISAGTIVGFMRFFNFFNFVIYQELIAITIRLIILVLFWFFYNVEIINLFFIYLISEILSKFFLFFAFLCKLKSKNICLQLFGVSTFLQFYNVEEDFFSTVISLSLSRLVISLTKKSDEILSGLLLGFELTGIYKIFKQVSSILNKLMDPVYIVMFPEFSRAIAQKRYKDVSFFIGKITTQLIVFVILFFALLFVYSEYLIFVLFSVDVSEYIYGFYFYFLGLGCLFVFIYQHPLMLSLSMDSLILKIHIFTSIIYLVSSTVLALSFGILGYCFGFMIYCFVESLIKYFFINLRFLNGAYYE